MEAWQRYGLLSNLLGYRSKHYTVIEFLYLITELNIKHIFIIDHISQLLATQPRTEV